MIQDKDGTSADFNITLARCCDTLIQPNLAETCLPQDESLGGNVDNKAVHFSLARPAVRFHAAALSFSEPILSSRPVLPPGDRRESQKRRLLSWVVASSHAAGSVGISMGT